MPALNFQPRFAPLVESGEKRCTIRAFRRDGFTNWAEMRDWFDQLHGLPFSGLLIEW
jgi:hypothetical protein